MRLVEKLWTPLAAAGAIIATGGCAVNETLAPPVTTAMVASGHSLTTLETGRRLYLTRCTACHSPDPVARYSSSRWEEIVADMAARSRLNSAERAALLAYLHAARRSQATERL